MKQRIASYNGGRAEHREFAQMSRFCPILVQADRAYYAYGVSRVGNSDGRLFNVVSIRMNESL